MDQSKIPVTLFWGLFFTSPCYNNILVFLLSEEFICTPADLHACLRYLVLCIGNVDGGSFASCHIPCHSRVLSLGKAGPDAVNSLIAVSMHPVNL